jgi:hypothetical protein
MLAAEGTEALTGKTGATEQLDCPKALRKERNITSTKIDGFIADVKRARTLSRLLFSRWTSRITVLSRQENAAAEIIP